jgi:hypothetical protein
VRLACLDDLGRLARDRDLSAAFPDDDCVGGLAVRMVEYTDDHIAEMPVVDRPHNWNTVPIDTG